MPDDRDIYRELTDPTNAELKRELAGACLDSTYLFGKIICGFRDMTPKTHLTMCQFWDDPTWPNRGQMHPRRHLKTSTLIARMLREITKNPWAAILYRSESEDKAKEPILAMKRIIRESPYYNAFYPHRVPDIHSKDARWSGTSFDIRRSPGEVHYNAPNIIALGIRTPPTSRNATMTVDDDIYTQEAARSELEAAQRWGAWKEGANCLIDPKTGQRLFAGTHWNTHDVYVQAFEEQGALLLTADGRGLLGQTSPEPTWLVWRRGCYVDGDPIWPERWDEAALQAKRREIGPAMFNLLWMNNPLAAGGTAFQAIKLRTWEHYGGQDDTIRLYNPAAGKWSDPINSASVDCIAIHDPAAGEKDHHSPTGQVVLWGDSDQNVIVRSSYKKRVPKATDDKKGWLDNLFKIQERYHPRVTLVESVGFQKIIGKDDIQRRNLTERFPINWKDLPLGGRAAAKDVRILNVIGTLLAYGRLYVNIGDTDYRQEVTVFPQGKHKELLDCTAHGVSELAYPRTPQQEHRARLASRRKAKSLGDITGYGFTED